MSVPELQLATVDNWKIAYREMGSGPPVVLLHGWPTHSWLWRDVMPAISESNRVIAVDLPGFGSSSKPLDHRYGFSFYEEVLTGLFDHLGIEKVGLAVHDLGGPVGLYWAVRNPERVERIALLNTLAYPEVSTAVKIFVAVCSLPGLRDLITSPRGIRFSMRYGVADDSKMTDRDAAPYVAPFRDRDSRRALADTARGLGPRGFEQIAQGLPQLEVPFRIVYGKQDKILPDVAKTMERVQADVGGCEVTVLEQAGHFCQEEAGPEIGALLAPFFAPAES